MSSLCWRKKAEKLWKQVHWDSARKHIIITTKYTNTFTTQREIPYLQTPASLFWRCLKFNDLQNILKKGFFHFFNQKSFLICENFSEKFSEKFSRGRKNKIEIKKNNLSIY